MKKELSREEMMKRYSHTVAHIISESLGYATPSCAAQILKDASEGKSNYCEWIMSCYACDPLPAVRNAIKHRHTHEGFMADYKTALALVNHAIKTGDEPLFASWF